MSAEGEQAEVIDRKELLSQQFDEAETEAAEATTEPSGPARAADGKFTKAEAKEEAAPAPEQTIEEPLWKRPPSSWKPEYREAWSTIDPKFQQYAWQREEEMRVGVQPLLTKAELADKITKVSEPYLNTIRGLGLDVPTAVEGLLKADHALRTLPPEQRQQYFAQLAQSYGINLAGVQPTQGAPVDPNYYALQQQFTKLNGEIVSFKQAQEERENQNVLAEINKFAPTVEHFEEVRPAMISLLQSGLADDLQSAYDKAIRLDSRLFESIQQRQQAAAVASERVTADKAAKAAKAAAVSVKSSTPGARTTTKAQDRRSMLAEQFDGIDERL